MSHAEMPPHGNLNPEGSSQPIAPEAKITGRLDEFDRLIQPPAHELSEAMSNAHAMLRMVGLSGAVRFAEEATASGTQLSSELIERLDNTVLTYVTDPNSPYLKDRSISISPDGRHLYAIRLEQRAVKVLTERGEL